MRQISKIYFTPKVELSNIFFSKKVRKWNQEVHKKQTHSFE